MPSSRPPCDLPRRMADGLRLRLVRLVGQPATAPAAFVVAARLRLGPAREIALKLTETFRVPALGYSAAELRHGPRAASRRDTGSAASAGDDAATAVDELARDLKRRRSGVLRRRRCHHCPGSAMVILLSIRSSCWFLLSRYRGVSTPAGDKPGRPATFE